MSFFFFNEGQEGKIIPAWEIGTRGMWEGIRKGAGG
jgi:hypothetical protein